ncbi:SAF domain-containing protein [Paenibacillus sp. MDMC362]|uniref:SAF domain-containing protein n=1 Tax=Paenibacillus sp. MDMC362 TaxID=2977365 RepID=UPI000DC2E30D|nr:SAF domain-containing protein [Paenibacillus sp. MDMC362]RAR45698.1 flagellar biosynthesis protein FlgA [Paenibacillus sp. MDMC362]
MPIIRRRSRKLIFAGLAGAAVTGAVCAGAMMYYVHGHKEQQSIERTKYEQRITELEETQLQQLNAMKIAWVPLKDIPPGHFIDAKDIMEVRLPDDGYSSNLFSIKEEIAGKGAKIELLQGTPITRSMLFEEEPTPSDLRHREMKSVYLPSNLRQGDVIDVRVQFPSGQDYIILSKKKIDRLQHPAFWTTLSEQEILLLSSALVDAYLHNATLYALTYVEPELQERAIPNYPPNVEVTKLIGSNPNIVKKAEKHFEVTLRNTLEEDLSKLQPNQQAQVSDMHHNSIFASGARSPDSWSPASNLSSQTKSSSDTKRNTADIRPDDEDNTETPHREERDSEAEQILGSSGRPAAEAGSDKETQEAELIFSSP